MLQIKTIQDTHPGRFDDRVNKALADGWTLARRLTGPDAFVAELEKNIITEDEKTCENCKHQYIHLEHEPCCSCTEICSEWEAEE